MLLVLGIARAITLPSLEYTTSDLEYGRHWNFFLTVACIHVLASLTIHLASFTNIYYVYVHAFVAILVMTAYELVLMQGGREFVFTAPRDDSLLHANREGIFSVAGYYVLHCAGVVMGSVMMDRQYMVAHLMCVCGWTWLALVVGTLYLPEYYKPSRRLV